VRRGGLERGERGVRRECGAHRVQLQLLEVRCVATQYSGAHASAPPRGAHGETSALMDGCESRNPKFVVAILDGDEDNGDVRALDRRCLDRAGGRRCG
jgi:hypothetical protein